MSPRSMMKLYTSLTIISFSLVTALSLKDKRICRSCGEFSKLIEKRLEETAAHPRAIEVAGRIGPDGRPIPSRKIDYLTSEARYMDIITDICDGLGYSGKSGCYLITNEYDDQLRDWYYNREPSSSFLESFCYKELPGCNKEINEASLTDIEMENYEEDKHQIDDDFMPEAKEENVKKSTSEQSFANKAVEKVKDVRDNVLDAWESLDDKAKKWILKNLLSNPKFEPFISKNFNKKHTDLLLGYWYIGIIGIVISCILPLLFVLTLCKRQRGSRKESKSAEKKHEGKSSKVRASKRGKSPIAAAVESSESDAVDADDEKVVSEQVHKTRSRVIKRSSARSVKNE